MSGEYIRQQEEVISSLATNPAEFARRIYRVRKQLNPKVFGPDVATSPFAAFGDPTLCQLVTELVNQRAENGVDQSSGDTIEKDGFSVKWRRLDDLDIQVSAGFIGSDQFTQSTLVSYLIQWYLRQLAPGLTTVETLWSAAPCSVPTPGVGGVRTWRYGVQQFEIVDLGTLLDLSRIQGFLVKADVRVTNPDSNGRDRVDYDSRVVVRSDSVVGRMIVKGDVIRTITKQVLTTLHLLQTNLLFSHGQLTADKIGLSSTPLNTTFGCFAFADQLTVKLRDFNLSAVTVNLNGTLYRLYPRSSAFDWISDLLPITDVQQTQLKTRHLSSATLAPVTLYSISPTLDFFRYQWYLQTQMNTPTRLFPTLDTYTFLLSFFLIPEVFYSVFSNPELISAIWDPLFYQDAPTVYQKLKSIVDFKETVSFEKIFNILKGVPLKYSVTSEVLQKLGDGVGSGNSPGACSAPECMQ